jgi:hypothetical protein
MPCIKIVRKHLFFLNTQRNYVLCTLFQKLWPVEVLLILLKLQAYNIYKMVYDMMTMCYLIVHRNYVHRRTSVY